MRVSVIVYLRRSRPVANSPDELPEAEPTNGTQLEIEWNEELETTALRPEGRSLFLNS
jgi:hypothetical protein